MAGKSRYERSKELIAQLKREKGSLISFEDLRKAIISTLGSDENRTVRPYVKLMHEMKLIMDHGEHIELK